MVVLVDDRDGARMQVDPEEVRPHLHAALQLVALLDSGKLAIHGVHTHCTCWQAAFRHWLLTDTKSFLSHEDVFCYLRNEAGK